MVTVIHLSFTTLLTSTLDVFMPVYIYTNTSDVPLKVWQNDGAVEYGKGGSTNTNDCYRSGSRFYPNNILNCMYY